MDTKVIWHEPKTASVHGRGNAATRHHHDSTCMHRSIAAWRGTHESRGPAQVRGPDQVQTCRNVSKFWDGTSALPTWAQNCGGGAPFPSVRQGRTERQLRCPQQLSRFACEYSYKIELPLHTPAPIIPEAGKVSANSVVHATFLASALHSPPSLMLHGTRTHMGCV